MYAIIGATGRTGRQATETLRSWGAPVRALVRSPEKAKDLAARGAELVEADVDDEASLVAGLRGVDGVYVVLTAPFDVADPLAVLKQRADRFARAAKAAGVGHVVLLSSVGAQHPDGTGPIAGLHHAEQQLRSAGVPSSFLRAAYFAQNWEQVAVPATSDGVLPTFLDATPIPTVDVRDIGRTAAELLVEGPQGVRIVELAGPEDIAPAHVARAFADASGREVMVAAHPAEVAADALTQQGLPAPVAAMYGEMYRGIVAGRVAWEGTPVRGRVPLADSIRQVVANV